MKYSSTKMADSELEFFVNKFKQLWKDGLGAHLDVDTYDGQAWVGLRVRLGHAADSPLQVHPPVKDQRPRNSPSRQRRSARRAAAKKHKEAETASDDIVNQEIETPDNEAEKASEEEILVDTSEQGVDFSQSHSENSAEIAN